MKLASWLAQAQVQRVKTKDKKEGLVGNVFFLPLKESLTLLQKIVEEHCLSWQKDNLIKNNKEMIYFVGQQGPVWIIQPHFFSKTDSMYLQGRDLMGQAVGFFRAHQLQKVKIDVANTNEDFLLGAFVGLDLAVYQYKNFENKNPYQDQPELVISSHEKINFKKIMDQAISIAQAVNLARYLVSLPPNLLNPKTFVDRAQNLTWPSTVKIETWDHLRLKKENMNLHLAVGQGAEHPSRLLKIQYRPAKAQSKKPIAFVGKGVTFDTGGLDLKPSSAMRLMKKDMGGAATVLALAYWVAESQYPLPCDFYVGLAENSVGEKSFRPSDVYTARNGKTVEIDNTDAEGRLVLADVLDVAVTSAADPDVVIDVATLTGAIKVALGVDIAGLFCNDEGLSAELQKAGRHSGDPNWPMPMPDKMMSSLASSFADFKNSGDGFGGAITAALFLKQFVRNKKWAHLDIYAWNDKSQGALTSVGGNGQGVQCLIHYLQAQIK